MSTKAATAPELKWHNSLPEDFNMRRAVSNPEPFRSLTTSRRKRSSMFTDVFDDSTAVMPPSSPTTAMTKGGLSLVSPNKVASNPVVSPTKRRRSTNPDADKTPSKPIRPSMTSGTRKGSNSGIHTPPPSSTSRRQGRSAKTIININHQTSSRAISPPPTSPSRTGFQTSDDLGKNLSSHGIEAKDHSELSFPDEFGPKRLFRTTKPAFLAGPGSEEVPPTVFDWSLMQNSLQDGIGDIFAPASSMRSTRGSSPDSSLTQSDSINYSFTESDGIEHAPFGVDPNLIFASQTSVGSSSSMNESSMHTSSFSVQQPYHHQQMQHQREQEWKIKRRLSTRGRTVARPQQPSLGKSSDHLSSLVRHNLKNIASDSLLISGTLRSSSPLQKPCHVRGFGRNGLQSAHKSDYDMSTVIRASPKKKTEVVLSISPGGRAKAETTVVDEDSDTEIDNEGEWDSLDESDSSFDDETPRGLGPDGGAYISFRRRSASDTVQSCYSMRQKKTLHVCDVPSTPRKTQVAQIFRESAIASSPRLPTPLKSSPPPTLASHKKGLIKHSLLETQSSRSDDESEAETVVDESKHSDDEDGDAMTALKRIVHARSRRERLSDEVLAQQTPTKINPSSARKAHTQPTSRRVDMVIDVKKESSPARRLFDSQAPRVSRSRRPPPDGGYHQSKSENMSNISPTTVTDPSEREGDDGGTRCTCGGSDDNGMTMVQCDSCKKWLHLKCIGYSRKSLPKVFICVFCHSDTPPARGRTRGRHAASRLATSPFAGLSVRR